MTVTLTTPLLPLKASSGVCHGTFARKLQLPTKTNKYTLETRPEEFRRRIFEQMFFHPGRRKPEEIGFGQGFRSLFESERNENTPNK